MAAYGDTNTKVKTFIHDASANEQDAAVGIMARDVQDYIAGLDDTNNVVISVSHCNLMGDRVLTMVVSGPYHIPAS
tara:strand:- start:908 stop:1135 length:228 start_codon:yes stop_codon:yes gene_type:complete